MKVTLIFLTLNEIEGLKGVFHKIPLGAFDEVFAVDGGSTDGTAEFFAEKGIPVHQQEVKGRGEAFRVAFRKSSGDALVFYSPDGNEDPLDLPKFRPLLEEGNDLVIATRMVKGAYNEEDIHWWRPRKWVNLAFTIIANILWNRGHWVSDTINGYRGITRRTWELIALDGPGYTIEYQSSIRAFKKNLKIKEFPTHESPRIDNGFGSPSLSTGMAFLKILLHEVRIGKRWKPLQESEEEVRKNRLAAAYWRG